MSAAGDAEAQIQLGLLHARNGWLDKAVDHFRSATEIDLESAVAHTHHGTALLALGRLEEAASALDRAICADPGDGEVRRILGLSLRELGVARQLEGRLAEAADSFAKAVDAIPEDAPAHHHLGLALVLLHRPEEALVSLGRAVDLDPNFVEAFHNLGVALTALRRQDEAVAAFSAALAINPDHKLARAQRMFVHAKDCDWNALEGDLSMVATLGIDGVAVSPFMMLSFEDHPQRHRKRSERYAAARGPVIAPTVERPRTRPEKLRIGYFSADFRNHAMVHLAGRMFELHDRDRFSIHAYALGPPSQDLARQRMVRAFDSFTDVEPMSDEAIAAKARGERIDIAVDLLGYTEGCRPGIFAHRAAPVQVSFLGYPGTSGAPFFDYLVADPTVIPGEHREAYSERLITLPFTYQPSDDQRRIAEQPITRAEAGLPERGFVFCCFNNSYKIKPTEFAIWMRLLANVEGSVLWLIAGSARTQDNLRAAAASNGVDPERLVFARPVPVADHLARHRLADLFVDTFHYNAHTTASDALWAGLPLVTKAGSGFAARVAASLLTAIGLDDLITTSDEQYFALALELARNPVKLAAIRERLAANRQTMPLFDSEQFTRHIEAGYEAAFQRFLEGKPPADITVAP